ncbi:coproporphyrinogen dehydrogenase HemZ [Veillonella sp. VA142]|uniref:coproporphyrinogen dehydrogenase HemZ n=1 Tax=Veillonella sp. VA142 TaxID=741834 RepID=UPI000F8DEAC3|nr:coproporphyrinogen dehydrogenase HemZ [Veillonella sp. VA142]
MHNTYWYDGPKELGSVIAHQCGAVGLFSSKENPDFIIHVSYDETESPLISEQEASYRESKQSEIVMMNLGASRELDAEAVVDYDDRRIAVKLFCHNSIQNELLETSVQASSELYSDYVHIWSLSGIDTVEGRKVIGREVLSELRRILGVKTSLWGTLVGVRPTKLTHKLWDSLGDLEQVRQELKRTHSISHVKWKLLEQVAVLERPYVVHVQQFPKEISLYSGIPFCETHCTYCSFPYGLIQNYEKVQNFVDVYHCDIKHMKRLVKTHGLKVQSLYMGGGTPTSLSNEDFYSILQALGGLISKGHEFTVEAGRPDSLNANKVQSIVDAGVTRISLNPQTMQDKLLRIIGRGHSVAEFLSMYDYVASHTNCSINMDFIAGLPRQTLGDMDENVRYIEQLRPHNVTIHTLALKKGSPLYGSRFANEIPSEDVVQTMLDETHEALLQLGYVPYYMYRQQYMVGQMENIGYTLPNYESIYNIQMIEERQSILSIGPGSVSKWIGGTDFRQQKQYMPKDVDTYIQDIQRLLEKRTLLSNEHWRDS